jgi:hypothetical protein
VWKNSVCFYHTSPILTSISTYPRGVDLAMRTDWCVWLPRIIVDPRKYFRSFHMCIYHLKNVCDMWNKFILFPSYLADPYQHQHAPSMRGLSVANRLVRMATMNNCRLTWIFWSPCMYIYHLQNFCHVWKKNQSIPIKPRSPWTASARTHSLTYLSVANSLVCVAPIITCRRI